MTLSAAPDEGLDQLLAVIGLKSELMEQRADPQLPAKGVVLESLIDKGRGPLTTVLIQSGSLSRGETVVVGTEWGRIRLMEDNDGKRVD